MVSLQLGAAHAPARHWPLWQSPAIMHARPFGHGAHGPPQSTSLSPPSLIPSPHAEVEQRWLAHSRLWQSDPARQWRLGAHPGHTPPPQSTSVSAPFFTPSLQLVTAHAPSLHTLLAQS